MSEPGLDFASPQKQASPSKSSSPAATQTRTEREPHPIGDSCLLARIVGRSQVAGNKARLLMAVPRGADVRVKGSGRVEGVADSGFEITEIEGNFAVAYTLNRVDMAELEGHTTATIECNPTRKPATSPVHARIIKREQVGDKIKITIAAGYVQGVFRDMKGKLTAPNGETFKVQDVEWDQRCYAFVHASHDDLIQYPNVIITP